MIAVLGKSHPNGRWAFINKSLQHKLVLILIFYTNCIVQRSRASKKSREQTPSAQGIREDSPKKAVFTGGKSRGMSKLLLGRKGGKLFKYRNRKQLVLLVLGKVRRSEHAECRVSMTGGAYSG